MSTERRVIFFGTPDFARIGLQAILEIPTIVVSVVVTQPDRPAGRGGKLVSSPVKDLAVSKNIPVLQPQSIRKNEAQFLADLSQFGPFDLGVVVAFGQILPQTLLDLPRKGMVNVHASLLPRWRGAAPIQRAIMSGDTKTGLCLMKMEAGLDTGPSYFSSEIYITPDDTYGTLTESLALLQEKLLKDHLVEIIEKNITPTTQREEGVTYAKKIENSEAAIQWDKPTLEVLNLIRGLSPVPGAFTTLAGKRFKILKAKASPLEASQKNIPGSLNARGNGELSVRCKDGYLILEEVQLEGKKRMSVKEFMQGTPLSEGIILGET